MSNILTYADEVIDSAHTLLWKINENDGKLTKKMSIDHIHEFKGQWGADSLNIVYALLRKDARVQGGTSASEKELEILIEKAKKHDPLTLASIARKRAARAEAK